MDILWLPQAWQTLLNVHSTHAHGSSLVEVLLSHATNLLLQPCNFCLPIDEKRRFVVLQLIIGPLAEEGWFWILVFNAWKIEADGFTLLNSKHILATNWKSINSIFSKIVFCSCVRKVLPLKIQIRLARGKSILVDVYNLTIIQTTCMTMLGHMLRISFGEGPCGRAIEMARRICPIANGGANFMPLPSFIGQTNFKTVLPASINRLCGATIWL